MKGRASPSPSEGGDVQIGCWLGVYCWWLVHALWTVWMYRQSVGLLVCWWSEIASLGGGDVPGGDLMLDVGIMKRAKNRDRCSMFNARNFEGQGKGDGI